MSKKLDSIIKLPPGSAKAVEAGCACPVYDNHKGAGVYDDGEHFWINGECGIHGFKYQELLNSDINDEG